MKIKLFTLAISIAILTFIIFQERLMLPTANSIYASGDIPQQYERDTKIPNFDFNIFNTNTTSSLYKLTSENIYIHFWASWCNVCTKEFDDIILFAKKHPNATILAISLDDEKEEMGKYLTKIEKSHKISKISNLLFVWDNNHAISQDLFNTIQVPETYLVDKEFKIIDKTIGRANWK